MSTLLFTLILVAQPNTEPITLLKTFRQEFVLITPGTGTFPKSFVMGRDEGPLNQRPAHKVTFEYTFHVGQYEVSQDLWQTVTGRNPSRWKGKRNSVEMLSFREAQEFCIKATKLMRAAKLITEKEEIRLPSEAEWEYFASAGTRTKYSFGDDIKRLDEYAWSTRNAAGNDPPVGAKKPNPWGLYDIHGYLWEWCADDTFDSYEDAPNDGMARTMKDGSKLGVLRSGSWKDDAHKLTSNYRFFVARELQDDAIGLRCVLAESK